MNRNYSQSSKSFLQCERESTPTISPDLAILKRKIDIADRSKSVMCRTDVTPERFEVE